MSRQGGRLAPNAGGTWAATCSAPSRTVVWRTGSTGTDARIHTSCASPTSRERRAVHHEHGGDHSEISWNGASWPSQTARASGRRIHHVLDEARTCSCATVWTASNCATPMRPGMGYAAVRSGAPLVPAGPEERKRRSHGRRNLPRLKFTSPRSTRTRYGSSPSTAWSGWTAVQFHVRISARPGPSATQWLDQLLSPRAASRSARSDDVVHGIAREVEIHEAPEGNARSTTSSWSRRCGS